MKTYVIADVHGRRDLLERALAMFEARRQPDDVFICLGDFVDRGPDSAGCVALLMERNRTEPERVRVLRGNHEDIMLKALYDPARYLQWWWGNGGGRTLASYMEAPPAPGERVETDSVLEAMERVPMEQRCWLATLPYSHEDEHRIYVHAGVPWDKPLIETSTETLTWMLYGYQADDVDWVAPDEHHVSGKHIVHGHHQSATHPLLLPGRTNLDAFAWHEGRLAIGVFEGAGGPVEILWAEGDRR